MAHAPVTNPASRSARTAQEALERFTAGFDRLAELDYHDDADSVLTVALAPEWMFRKANAFFDHVEMQTIFEGIKAYSATKRDWLIVPGSILWAMPAHIDVPVPAKWFWESDTVVRKPVLTVYNTVPIVAAGALVHMYHKQYEGLDIRPKVDSEFFGFHPSRTEGWQADAFWDNWRTLARETNPGTGKKLLQCRFEHRELKMGIEVCADHSQSPSPLLSECTDERVDVHLVVSCGMEIKAKAVAARIGGWFVHSDGNTARDLDSQKKCGLAVARVTGVQVNAVSGNSFATFEPGIRDVYTLANKRFRGGVEDLVIGYNDALRLT